MRAADKEGGVVVQDCEKYHTEALNILSDNNYYQRIANDPHPSLKRELYLLLKTALGKHTNEGGI